MPRLFFVDQGPKRIARFLASKVCAHATGISTSNPPSQKGESGNHSYKAQSPKAMLTKSSVRPWTGLLLDGGNATVRFCKKIHLRAEKPEGQILDKVMPPCLASHGSHLRVGKKNSALWLKVS